MPDYIVEDTDVNRIDVGSIYDIEYMYFAGEDDVTLMCDSRR